MNGPSPPLKIPKFPDNFRNYTFVLNVEELESLKTSGRIGISRSPGHPFLNVLWWSAAEVRGLIDVAAPLKDQPYRRTTGTDRRKERAAGGAAYYAILEQALVAIVSAWEVFLRDAVVYVLNHASYVTRLADRNDEPLKRLAREFHLTDDMLLSFMAKGFDVSRVSLGNVLRNARPGVRWQNLDECKKVVSLLYPGFDISSVARDWKADKKLFEDRHRIVHAAGEESRTVEEPDVEWVENEYGEGRFEVIGTTLTEATFDIIQNYRPKEIEAVLDDLLVVAEALHLRLFSIYTPDP